MEAGALNCFALRSVGQMWSIPAAPYDSEAGPEPATTQPNNRPIPATSQPCLVLGLGLGRLKGAGQDGNLHIMQFLGHLHMERGCDSWQQVESKYLELEAGGDNNPHTTRLRGHMYNSHASVECMWPWVPRLTVQARGAASDVGGSCQIKGGGSQVRQG